MIQNPTVSIDRESKSYSFLDGFSWLTEFLPYDNEEEVKQKAIIFFKDKTDVEIQFIYPRIDSIKITYSRPRRKKSVKSA